MYDSLSTFTHRTEARPLECSTCHRFYAAGDILATIEDVRTCRACVADHSTPGKFEAYSDDAEEMATVLALYASMLSSGEDDFMSSDGWGYCGRFGTFLLFEDERGAVTFEEYATSDKAQKRFDSLYDEGMAARIASCSSPLPAGSHIMRGASA